MAEWSNFITSFTAAEAGSGSAAGRENEDPENQTDSNMNVRLSEDPRAGGSGRRLSEKPVDTPRKKLFATPRPHEAAESPAPPKLPKSVLTPSTSAGTPLKTPTRTPSKRTPAKTATPLTKKSITSQYWKSKRLSPGRRNSPGVHKVRRNRYPLVTPKRLQVTPHTSARRTTPVKIPSTPTTKRRYETQNPEFWLQERAGHLKCWINWILEPDQPSRHSLVGSYAECPVLAARIKATYELFRSDSVQTTYSRLHDEIASQRIYVDRQVRFRTHHEHQDFLVRLILVNYNPNWLYPALCVVFGLNFGLQMDQALGQARAESRSEDRALMQAMEDILREHLLKPTARPLGEAVATPQTPRTRDAHENRHEDNFNGTVMLYTFALVLLLDLAKQSHSKVIETDPPLFRSDSEMASSEDVIEKFSLRFLAGQGNVIRFLYHRKYALSFVAPLAERIRDLSVQDMFQDIRDGVRLCKLASIITKSPNMMTKVQVTKNTTREGFTKSLRNVNMAMAHLENFFHKDKAMEVHWEAQSPEVAGIGRDGKDNRSKTLTLVRQFAEIWVRTIVLDRPLLAQEVGILRASYENLLAQREAETKRSAWGKQKAFDPSKNTPVFMGSECAEAQNLVEWTAYVCASLDGGMQVREFTESFRDGVALCYLVHYYRPDVLAMDGVKRVISYDARDEFVPQEAMLVQNNLDLFWKAVVDLGGVPLFPVSVRSAIAPMLTKGKDETYGRLMFLITAYLFRRLVPEFRRGDEREDISEMLGKTISIAPVVIQGTPRRVDAPSPKKARTSYAQKFGQPIAFRPKLTLLTPSKLMKPTTTSTAAVESVAVAPAPAPADDSPVSGNTDAMSTVTVEAPAPSAERFSPTGSTEAEAVTIQAAARLYLSRRKTVAYEAELRRAVAVIERTWSAFDFRRTTEAALAKQKAHREARKSLFDWTAKTREMVEGTRRLFAQVESRMRAARTVKKGMVRIERENAAVDIQRAIRRMQARKVGAAAVAAQTKVVAKSNAVAAAGVAVAGMIAAVAARRAVTDRATGVLALGQIAFDSVMGQRAAVMAKTQTAAMAGALAFGMQMKEYTATQRAAVAADRTELFAAAQGVRHAGTVYDEYASEVDTDSESDDDGEGGLDDMLEAENPAVQTSDAADARWVTANQLVDTDTFNFNSLAQRADQNDAETRQETTQLAEKATQLDEAEAEEDALTAQTRTQDALKRADAEKNYKAKAIAAASFAVAGMVAALAHGTRTGSMLEKAEAAFVTTVGQRAVAATQTDAARAAAKAGAIAFATGMQQQTQAAAEAEQAEQDAMQNNLWELDEAYSEADFGNDADEYVADDAVLEDEDDAARASGEAETGWINSNKLIDADASAFNDVDTEAALEDSDARFDENELSAEETLLEDEALARSAYESQVGAQQWAARRASTQNKSEINTLDAGRAHGEETTGILEKGEAAFLSTMANRAAVTVTATTVAAGIQRERARYSKEVKASHRKDHLELCDAQLALDESADTVERMEEELEEEKDGEVALEVEAESAAAGASRAADRDWTRAVRLADKETREMAAALAKSAVAVAESDGEEMRLAERDSELASIAAGEAHGDRTFGELVRAAHAFRVTMGARAAAAAAASAAATLTGKTISNRRIESTQADAAAAFAEHNAIAAGERSLESLYASALLSITHADDYQSVNRTLALEADTFRCSRAADRAWTEANELVDGDASAFRDFRQLAILEDAEIRCDEDELATQEALLEDEEMARMEYETHVGRQKWEERRREMQLMSEVDEIAKAEAEAEMERMAEAKAAAEAKVAEVAAAEAAAFEFAKAEAAAAEAATARAAAVEAYSAGVSPKQPGSESRRRGDRTVRFADSEQRADPFAPEPVGVGVSPHLLAAAGMATAGALAAGASQAAAPQHVDNMATLAAVAASVATAGGVGSQGGKRLLPVGVQADRLASKSPAASATASYTDSSYADSSPGGSYVDSVHSSAAKYAGKRPVHFRAGRKSLPSSSPSVSATASYTDSSYAETSPAVSGAPASVDPLDASAFHTPAYKTQKDVMFTPAFKTPGGRDAFFTPAYKPDNLADVWSASRGASSSGGQAASSLQATTPGSSYTPSSLGPGEKATQTDSSEVAHRTTSVVSPSLLVEEEKGTQTGLSDSKEARTQTRTSISSRSGPQPTAGSPTASAHSTTAESNMRRPATSSASLSTTLAQSLAGDLKAATSYVVQTNNNICKTSADTMSIFHEMGGFPSAMHGDRPSAESLDGPSLAQWEADFGRSLQTPSQAVIQLHRERCEARERAADRRTLGDGGSRLNTYVSGPVNGDSYTTPVAVGAHLSANRRSHGDARFSAELRTLGYGGMFDGVAGLSAELDAIAAQFEKTPVSASMGKAAVTASRIPSTIRRLSLLASSSKTTRYSTQEARAFREKETSRTLETMRMALLIVRACSKRRGESRFVVQALALLRRLCAGRHCPGLLLSIPDSFDVLVTCAQFYREEGVAVLRPCVELLNTLGEDDRLRAVMARRTPSVIVLTELARFLKTREEQIVRTGQELDSANKLLEELARRGVAIVDDTPKAAEEAVFSDEMRACWRSLVDFNRALNIETR